MFRISQQTCKFPMETIIIQYSHNAQALTQAHFLAPALHLAQEVCLYKEKGILRMYLKQHAFMAYSLEK